MRRLFSARALARVLVSAVTAALLLPTVVAAPAQAAVTSCNTGASSLSFDSANMTYLKNVSGANNNSGKNEGDRTLFTSATALCGGLDVVVTTKTLNGASVSKIDDGNAGATNDFLETDLSVSTSADSYVEFQYDFYVGGQIPATANGVIPVGVTPITLYNVLVTTIDIDSRQFNRFSSVDGYTVSNPSNLIITRYTPGTQTTTTSWPADLEAGAPGTGNNSNLEADRITLNYGTLAPGFTIREGAYSNTPQNLA